MEEYLNKIICGDCLEVMKKLPDNSIDCVITSPPYNKNNKKKPNSSWARMNIDYEVYDDNLPEEQYQEWQKAIIAELLRVIKPEGSIFYNHKPRYRNLRCLLPTDFIPMKNLRQLIIWQRYSSPNVSPITFMQNTEHIYWLCKDKPRFNKEFFRFGEVWKMNYDIGNNHPAPFPITIPNRCIEATTKAGDIVLDPFMGSGTTAMSAKQLDRNFIGVELNPEYCEIAKERLKNLQPTLI